MKPDARWQWRTYRAYTVQLIDKAQNVAGSRNQLSKLSGISRSRLGYIEAGYRQTEKGIVPVRMSFAEQILLEAIACQSSA